MKTMAFVVLGDAARRRRRSSRGVPAASSSAGLWWWFLLAAASSALLQLTAAVAADSIIPNAEDVLSTMTSVDLQEQLAGSTMYYRVNANDDRAAPGGAAADTVTFVYEVPNESGWIAIGFSDNGGFMTGSSAVIGWPDTGEVAKYDMTGITEAEVVPYPESRQTLIDPSIVRTDAGVVLNFTKIAVEDGEIPLAVDGSNTLLGAIGFGSFWIHKARGSFAVDFVGGGVAAVETRVRIYWKVHGWLAALAWGVLSPIAIGVALCRPWFPDGLWFKIHTNLNYLVTATTIAAFAVAVAAIAVESPAGSGAAVHFARNPHSFVGLVVFLLVLFQSGWGQYRPPNPKEGEEKSAFRRTWEVSHRVLGIGLLAAAWYQVDSGIGIYRKLFDDGGGGGVNATAAFWGVTGTIAGLFVLGYAHIKIKEMYGDDENDHDAADSPKNNKDAKEATQNGDQQNENTESS